MTSTKIGFRGPERVFPGIAVQEIPPGPESDSPDVIECLLRVAKLYCWLISRYHICPWLLIRFEANMLLFDFHQLIRDLADALQSAPQSSHHDPREARVRSVLRLLDKQLRQSRPSGRWSACFLVPLAWPSIRGYVRQDKRRNCKPSQHPRKSFLQGEMVELVWGPSRRP
ncbi:hypothetical protein MRX96_024265 [Rhipicephalus microplus]